MAITVCGQGSVNLFSMVPSFKFLRTIGKGTLGEIPYGVVFTSSNNILVSDYFNYRIVEFTLDGAFEREIYAGQFFSSNPTLSTRPLSLALFGDVIATGTDGGTDNGTSQIRLIS